MGPADTMPFPSVPRDPRPLSLSPRLGALTQHSLHLAGNPGHVPAPRLVSINSAGGLAPKEHLTLCTQRTVAHQAPCPWDLPGKNTGVGCHSLLQRIFPTQGLNPGLVYCRQISAVQADASPPEPPGKPIRWWNYLHKPFQLRVVGTPGGRGRVPLFILLYRKALPWTLEGRGVGGWGL